MTLNYATAIYALDDSDLDVYQSRVWLRVLRRGVCFESQRSMADGMNISLGKVNQALQWLLENGWIVRDVDQRTQKMGYVAVIPDEQTQQNLLHDMNDVLPDERDVLPHEHSVLPHERHLKAKEIKQKTKVATVAAAANENTDSAIVFYENHIDGITPHSSQLILDAVDTYSEPMVVDAMREAVANNVRKWKYIEAILKNWKQNGRKTLSKNGTNGHAAHAGITNTDGSFY
jgi:DnaD/phage-associated family protein